MRELIPKRQDRSKAAVNPTTDTTYGEAPGGASPSWYTNKWVLVSIVASVILVGWLGMRIWQNVFKPIKSDVDQAVLTVMVQPAQRMQIHRHLKLSGSVWAWDPLTIGAEIGGLRIAAVNVEEGDVVKKGQVLATLNSSVIKAQLERQQARLNRAEISLEKTKQPNRPMDINRLKAVVQQTAAVVSQEQSNLVHAKANLKNAFASAERYKVLSAEGAVSQEDFDNKTMLKDTAEADFHAAEKRLSAAMFLKIQAEENLKLALEGGMKQDIQIAGADLRETQANINELKAQLEQTIIRAPSDGLIVKRLAHIGDISVANKELFQMVRDSRFEVRAQVPEQDLPKIKPGQVVEFQCAATGSKRLPGRVREISPLIDTATRLATVRIDLPCERGWLPGTFASGLVDLGQVDALVVPAPSVIDRDGRKMVFVLDGKRVFAREIKVGERVGDLVEVWSGIAAGEPVVITGSGFLKDGDPVRISEHPTSAGETTNQEGSK